MSAKISEESQIVFAEELQTEWPEDGQEFSVYFFPVYQTKNSEKYFFLEHSSDFQMCGEITGLNCFSLLRMVEAEYFGSREDFDEMFKQRQAYLFEKKVLIEDDQGDFYLTQGIFVDDLVKAIEEKNQSR